MLAEQLRAAGAMAVLLKDAIKPNLVQTLEGQPALVHCGPVREHRARQQLARRRSAWRSSSASTSSPSPASARTWGWRSSSTSSAASADVQPSAVVLVATAKALKHHGGDPDGGLDAIERGSANLARHLAIIAGFGLKAVVAVNRFPGDPREEVALVRRLALEHGAHAAELNEAFERGGEGAAGARRGGRRRRRAAERVPSSPTARRADRRQDRGDRARRSTARTGSSSCRRRRTRSRRYTRDGGLDRLPICMAKTHLSLSHDPELRNAPTGFEVTVRDIRAYTGAGWLVALCGTMQTMPGLGADPGRVHRRHRRGRAHRWPLLSRSSSCGCRSSSTQCRRGRPLQEAGRSRRSQRRSPRG